MSEIREGQPLVSNDCGFNAHTECAYDICTCSCHALVKQALSAQLATIAKAVGELNVIHGTYEDKDGYGVVQLSEVVEILDKAIEEAGK